MKAVAAVKLGNRITGESGQVGVVDFPFPELGPEDVLIKVAYCSICGSDPHVFSGDFEVPLPYGLGHEVSGTIVDLGPKATIKKLKVGDRVAGNFYKACGTCYYCRNGQENICENIRESKKTGMAEYVVWHEQQVYKIPDSVSLEEAALLEPVAIAVRGIERADMKIGARVAVSGAGGLGLILVQLAKMSGASSVTVIEPVEGKRKLAKELGADHVIHPGVDDIMGKAMQISNGLVFDAVIESSGAPAATKPALDMLAKGGTVVYFAMYPQTFELPVNLFMNTYWKEVTIRGFFNSPHVFPRAVALLPRLNLKPLIQKIYSIDDAVDAFHAQGTGQYAKVLIQCS